MDGEVGGLRNWHHWDRETGFLNSLAMFPRQHVYNNVMRQKNVIIAYL